MQPLAAALVRLASTIMVQLRALWITVKQVDYTAYLEWLVTISASEMIFPTAF